MWMTDKEFNKEIKKFDIPKICRRTGLSESKIKNAIYTKEFSKKYSNLKKQLTRFFVLSLFLSVVVLIYWLVFYSKEIPLIKTLHIPSIFEREFIIYELSFNISRLWDVLLGPIWSAIIFISLYMIEDNHRKENPTYSGYKDFKESVNIGLGLFSLGFLYRYLVLCLI